MPGAHPSRLPAAADSTPTRLLDAAERLIGRHGVDGVSVRSINAEANSNVAAAHYHFGSKQALVLAALERRMGALAAERLAMLEPLERLRRPPVAAVVEALVLPLAGLAGSDQGRSYVRFLATLDRSGDPWRRLVATSFAAQWERIEPVLARSLPDLPGELRRFRSSVAGTTLLELLAEPERHLAGATGELAGAGLIPAIIDIVTGVLTGPPTTGRRT